ARPPRPPPAVHTPPPHNRPRHFTPAPAGAEAAVGRGPPAAPANPVLIDDLRQMLGAKVSLCVAPAPAILEAIERAYGASTPLQKIVEGIASGEAPEGEADINHLRDMGFEAPVVRLVNVLIAEAVASEASDIHVLPVEDRLRVRYRMDGILYDRESPPRKLQAALTSRIKLMAEMNIAERRLPQDGRIRVTAGGRRVDIRVSTVPTVHGE